MSSGKMTIENCLRTINMCLFWISSTMVAIFAESLSYFTKVLSFCMKMPGIIHPTGQLFIAVHLKHYGSVPILCSVFYFLLNAWEAPGWQVIAVDADVKQVITFWLQTCDNSMFTLDYELSYQCGVNAEMVVVTTLRSDVYHLLHMYHVLIKVTVSFWHECLLPYFLEVLCMYIAVWAGGFVSTGCSVWWGFCVICW